MTKKSNVRSYTDKAILKRVKELPDYKIIPEGYWLAFVRSNEDEFDAFDDKAYLFKNESFVMVTTCTTNKGGFGSAVIKSDQWLYDGFINGLHKGKMECLRQNKPFYFYRDKNGDKNTDEVGTLYLENIQVQFHGSTYHTGAPVERDSIGRWSEGCIVANINRDYERVIELTRAQSLVSGVLLMEWDD